jgi:uncharacterized radical SAM superfamily protein
MYGFVDLEEFTKERKKTVIKLISRLHIASFELIIQESEILKEIYNLHKQTQLFKQQLNTDLKKKILDHIKTNFLKEIQQM